MTGGGLTVIANAPNPPVQARCSAGGSPAAGRWPEVRSVCLLGALGPTLVAIMLFRLV